MSKAALDNLRVIDASEGFEGGYYTQARYARHTGALVDTLRPELECTVLSARSSQHRQEESIG